MAYLLRDRKVKRSYNGVGDQITVNFVQDGQILAGVLDGYTADNYGEIVIEVR